MSPSRNDRRLLRLLRAAAILAGTVLLLILLFLMWESGPALRHVGASRFVTDESWHPAPAADDGLFNLLPMVAGTLLITVTSVLLATPLGVGTAVFCRYYAPPQLAMIVRRVVELLGGIPSVVFGFWGLVVLVPLIAAWQPPGTSLLAGTLVLTLMILPTVALVADAAFANVPAELLQAAAALGFSRWGTIRGVVFTAARSGLFTGVLLQTGRALGETMAVLMVCGNVVQVPDSFFAPLRTLTANIALEMAYAMGDHRSALFVSGLVLTLIVAVLVLIADRLQREPTHG